MSNEQQEGPAQTSPATPQMSYSRMNSILTCGEQFRLERKLKVPVRAHWASVGGSAFHNCVEAILKAEHKQQMQSEPKGGDK